MDSQGRHEDRCILAAEVLQSSGILTLRASGASMLPALWPGDVLTVESFEHQRAEPGEIVLYMRENRFFIHRIVSINMNTDRRTSSFVIRGDSMPANDPPVAAAELLGKVTQVRRRNSVFIPTRKLSRGGRLLAWLFCHCDFFRRMGLRIEAYRQACGRPAETAFVNPLSRTDGGGAARLPSRGAAQA